MTIHQAFVLPRWSLLSLPVTYLLYLPMGPDHNPSPSLAPQHMAFIQRDRRGAQNRRALPLGKNAYLSYTNL